MRKYYAAPVQNPAQAVAEVADAVLQRVLQEEKGNVVNAVLRESVEQDETLSQIVLDKEDIENVRREVVKYRQRYMLTKTRG